MFDIKLLDDLLPDGAVAQWIQREDGRDVLNITGIDRAWQVAIDEQLDDPQYALERAWSMQAEYEHITRLAAARKEWHRKIEDLAEQHRVDRAKKIADAHAKRQAKRDESR